MKTSFTMKTPFLSWFKAVKQPNKTDYLLLIIFSLLFYTAYLYTDISITVNNTVHLWDYLFEGRLLEFYSLEHNTFIYNNTIMGDALYDFPIYLIFAVWNFPLWLAHRFGGIEVISNTACMLWAKTMLFPFLIGTAHYVKKICLETGISKEHAKWSVFIFFSSAFVLSSIFVLCQYDIIGIFFTMIGIYYYVKEDMKKFTLFIAVSMPLKTFALFIFLPLLLLKEKKVWNMIKYGFYSMSIFLAWQVFALLLGITSTSSFMLSMMNKLMDGNIRAGIGNASLFIGFYLLLCIYCYLHKTDSKEEHNRFSVYIPFVVWGLFFMFCSANPYWTILITPYFAILVFMNGRFFKVSLLIEGIAAAAFILAQNFVYYWCFSYKWIMPVMPLSKLIKPIPEMIQENNLAVLGLTDVQQTVDGLVLPLLLGIYVFAMLALFLLHFPGKIPLLQDNKGKVPTASEAPPVIERSVIWFRMAAGIGVCLIPIGFYLLDLFI